MEHKTVITAHSGCENTPANSMEHILAAIECGAEFLEIDVRREEGGRLYLYHDRPEDPAVCVDFKEFLKTILPHSIKVNNDLKEEGLIRPVLEAAEEIGGAPLAARMYFTGETYGRGNDVAALAEKYEGLRARIWLNTGLEGFAEAVDAAQKEGCPVMNVHYSVVTDETRALLAERGMNFSGWTADSEEVIRFLLSCGVTNITTRKPKLALALRAESEAAEA